MNWIRAVHHVETAAEECARIAALPVTVSPLRVMQLWAFGDVLGSPQDVEQVSVALVVDLPADEVAWRTQPKGAEHWLSMTRLPKNPVVVTWRSAQAPVWNHRVVSPLLVWDIAEGHVDGALDALREGRGAASGLPAPTSDELAARVAEELAISLAVVRTCTSAYGDRQWGPTKLGPTADALWLACDGYLDLLDAQAAGDRTAQPFSSSL